MTATDAIFKYSCVFYGAKNAPNPSALASIALDTEYTFDSNVIAKVMVVDDKNASPCH